MSKDQRAVELGRLGGKKTKEIYGKDHYIKRAEHMNKVLAERKKQNQNSSNLASK